MPAMMQQPSMMPMIPLMGGYDAADATDGEYDVADDATTTSNDDDAAAATDDGAEGKRQRQRKQKRGKRQRQRLMSKVSECMGANRSADNQLLTCPMQLNASQQHLGCKYIPI
jgi:hypothetical protein